MPRFKCTVEYDGTPYAGWQWQEDQPSVQGAIEQAIKDFCQESVRIQCAGRTDAGVHARGQVMHLDILKNRSAYQVMEGLNHHLWQRGQSVRLVACERVTDTFHARFSATGRHYHYRIINRRAPLVLEHQRAWHVGWPLDIDAMRAGASHLIGKHDFTSFRAVECQADNPVKTLDRLEIATQDEHIEFYLSARSFLHHQVRIIVGTLERIGAGKWTPDHMQAILSAQDRLAAGPTAPACGLYLTRVDYD